MMKYPPIDKGTEEVASQIVEAAFQIHRALGPGLLEAAYQKCFEYELRSRGLAVCQQAPIVVEYKSIRLDTTLRLDFLVENRIAVELKAVERLHPVHEAQLLTYMKLAECRLGFLLNFNTDRMKNGIFRRIL